MLSLSRAGARASSPSEFAQVSWNLIFIATLLYVVATSIRGGLLTAAQQRCPPLFGEYECPLNYECTVQGHCISAGHPGSGSKDPQPTTCSTVQCSEDSRCVSGGKCLPLENLPCNRNTLVGKNVARAIRSNCGRRGRCVNGRCSMDNPLVECHDVLCDPVSGELCRDGHCVKLLGTFCFSIFDCGFLPGWECVDNRCVPILLDELLHSRSGAVVISTNKPAPVLVHSFHTGRKKHYRCEAGESRQADGSCQRVAPGTSSSSNSNNDDCAHLVCDPGESCLQGACVPVSIDCAHDGDCPHSSALRMICQKRRGAGAGSVNNVRGQCIRDPCWERCPPDHACHSGECRLLQGLPCSTSLAEGEDLCERHKGFYCIHGHCVKDECYKKVCQIGERCESGLCIAVEGRQCRDTHRDCGEAFDCDDTQHCRDRIWLLSGASNTTILLGN